MARLGAHLAKPEGRWGPGGSPARALCSSSRYRISGASIFQSHKIASNTASGGPSHHAKISHGGCAIASAEFLKSRNPHSEVAVKDLQTGEVTVVVKAWAG